MKARVKGTTNIIEVEFSAGALNAWLPPYYDRENNMYYESEQLVWMDNENAEPDYWTRLEHQYAGMAMQGLVSSYEAMQEIARKRDIPQHVANMAFRLAHALVEKYKKEK